MEGVLYKWTNYLAGRQGGRARGAAAVGARLGLGRDAVLLPLPRGVPASRGRPELSVTLWLRHWCSEPSPGERPSVATVAALGRRSPGAPGPGQGTRLAEQRQRSRLSPAAGGRAGPEPREPTAPTAPGSRPGELSPALAFCRAPLATWIAPCRVSQRPSVGQGAPVSQPGKHMMNLSFIKCIFGSAAEKKSVPNASICLVLFGCNRDTIFFWSRQRAGCGVKVKHFSSDTVIGLIVSQRWITYHASCYAALAVSSLHSGSSALHMCNSASAYADCECGEV